MSGPDAEVRRAEAARWLAAMHSETLQQFRKTRNAPGALYSVAGADAGKTSWDRKV